MAENPNFPDIQPPPLAEDRPATAVNEAVSTWNKWIALSSGLHEAGALHDSHESVGLITLAAARAAAMSPMVASRSI